MLKHASFVHNSGFEGGVMVWARVQSSALRKKGKKTRKEDGSYRQYRGACNDFEE